MSSAENISKNQILSEVLFASPAGQRVESADGWWGRYVSQLGELSPTAKNILETDCTYIVDQGIFGDGEPTSESWPETGVRRGLVFGSVQSGKTASMFGVTAMALDRKVDLVIILAGTRLSLWRQTIDRFGTQLDTWPDGATKEKSRLMSPRQSEVAGVEGRAPLSSLYNFEPAQVRRAVREGRPIVVVAMKHADHLRALGKSIRENIFGTIASSVKPFHMLVLDDEADDGSILDAAVEKGEDPVYGRLKQIPRAIADLWDPRIGEQPPNRFATYLAYTATPQANFLQQDHNPLAPKDFVIALRTALDRGDNLPRTSTYFEPAGLKAYYTGGEVFYRRAGASLCVPTEGPASDDQADAVRAFLVASAIRQLRDPNKLGPDSARLRTFESRDEAVALSPGPRSMLIHPSALVSDHFAVAAELLRWAGESDLGEARAKLSSGTAYLSNALVDDLKNDSKPWRAWLESYRRSAESVRGEFDLPTSSFMPAWDDIENILRTEIIPGTRVSVVNSAPDADDRPEYDPWLDEDGWHAARDTSTIFISGNVMSRGLTLEGLSTTLFLRHSSQPYADTQMQMQRWFGYRGSYIELCRVMAPQQQLDAFAAYHEGDESLRLTVLSAMNRNLPRAPSPYVLQGSGFLATGKIGNLGNKPLCPGAKPFVRLINQAVYEDPNAALLASIFRDKTSDDVRVAGLSRGRIAKQSLSLDEAAGLIDQLRFTGYARGSATWQSDLWAQVQTRVESQGTLADPAGLYRPALPEPGFPASLARTDCPYAISAYLRLWSACLTRHVRGLVPTESPTVPWSRVDLGARKKLQPRFWVGIRYGSGVVVDESPLGDLPFKIASTERTVVDGLVSATWGSRDPNADSTGFRGDEYLDYYHRGETPPAIVAGESPWRPVGSDGLILFYVNKLPGDTYATVAVGVCIPLGGPDQFAATVRTVPSLAGAK